MKKQIRKTVAVLLLLMSTLLSACAGSVAGTQFTFSSYKTVEKTPYEVFFDESYFDRPASIYNPSLASATACLALAGFSAAASDDFSVSGDNARAFFEALGFEDYRANADGVSKPNDSTFGVYVASRKQSDYTLIGVTVRGAGYLAEWASNFTLGENENFAQGFLDASENYLYTLTEYIKDFGITGKIKVWTGGYSRGGAVVNIAAGRIDEALIAGENILSDRVNYTKDDIYAYSFEAPAGRIGHVEDGAFIEKGEDYSNIFTVMNLNDPVPFVAPGDYGFIRYGTDLFLPDVVTDLDYQEHVDLVKKRMTELPNYQTIGDYKIDTFSDTSIISFLNDIDSIYVNITPYLYLRDLIEMICRSVGSRAKYVEVFQGPVTELFKFLYSFLKPKDSAINLAISIGKDVLMNDINEVFLFDLRNNPERFIQDFEPLIYNSFRKYGVNVTFEDVAGILKQLVKLFVYILFSENGMRLLRPIVNSENVGALGSAHIPELLLTHVTSLDPNYENSGLKVRSVFNVLYIDTESEFELTVNGEKYLYFENGGVVTKLSGKKTSSGYMFCLPADAEVGITSKGEASYVLYEHSNSCATDRIIRAGEV